MYLALRLGSRDVTGGDLALVGGEGGEDLALLVVRDFEDVERPSEFCSDLIEFGG